MRLEFDGKQQVYGHHLTVPLSPLIPDYGESVPSADGEYDDSNLIVHGDNLRALKALMPRYAGRVKCVFIDPPYNTGNEGWVYNDNVNSPLMRKWLEDNKPVDGEDMDRHDKWACMMWPRLQLLRELLSDDGIIFVTIDDNEQHYLRVLLDEIFGETIFIACLPTVMNLKGNNDEFGFAGTHEYTLCWAKDKSLAEIGEFQLDDEELEDWQEDEFGYYKQGANLKATGVNAPRQKRPNLYFPVFVGQNDEIFIVDDESLVPENCVPVFPITGDQQMSWRWSKEKFIKDSHDVIVSKTNSGIGLYKKQRPSIGDLPSRKPKSLMYKPEYSSGNGTAEMKSIFGEKTYNYPKPTRLIMDLIYLGANEDSVILDSFAGSGTTAHAVLALNEELGGNRKFILVECEDYADRITAERVRRVISGVPGARNARLRDGYGGSFTFCTLGEPLSVSSMLSGESLPSFRDMAVWAYHTATGKAVDPSEIDDSGDGPFYRDGERSFWLLYEPDVEWLRSPASALSEAFADRVAESGGSSVVFASHKHVPQRRLSDMGIVFCQLPYGEVV